MNFEQGTYTVAEGSSVTVTVTLSDDPEQTVTIPITRMDQGGATSDDYASVPTSLTFNSGDTEKTFTFIAQDDTLDDDGESVKLTFGTLPSTPMAVTAGSPDETVISIADDDGAGLVIDTAALTVDEDGSDTFSVRLATQPTGNVTVSVTSGDTGAATVSPATRTFNTSDWNIYQTFTVSGVDDTDAQDETLTVSLSASGADYARVTGSVTVNVTDDDPPTSLTVSFGAPTYTVAEGGSATVTVTLSDDPEQTVTIPLNKDGPGRGIQRRLLRRPAQRRLQLWRHRKDLHLHGHPRYPGR